MKSKPSLTPGKPRPLSESLALARRNPEEARDLRVSLHVAGGVAGQAYTLQFEAFGRGNVTCRMRCELSKREGRARDVRLASKRFTALLDRIHASKLLEMAPQPTGFLPDTLVGRLEISDGRNVYRTYFAADAEQAKVQGRPVPRALADAVDAIYALAGELMGVKSVKP